MTPATELEIMSTRLGASGVLYNFDYLPPLSKGVYSDTAPFREKAYGLRVN